MVTFPPAGMVVLEDKLSGEFKINCKELPPKVALAAVILKLLPTVPFWVRVAVPMIPFLNVLEEPPEKVNELFTSNIPLISIGELPPGVPLTLETRKIGTFDPALGK